MNRSVLLFPALLFIRLCCAQEYIGIRNSNYAGINSVFLNPASIAGAKIKWDINAASAGMFLDNDFFYAPKEKISFFGFKKLENGIRNNTNISTHFDQANPNRLYQLVSSAEVIGPSFYMSVSQRAQIGFTIAARGYANIHQAPGHLGQNAYKDLKDPTLWNTEWQDHSSNLNSMSWLEYGLHYARVLYRDANKEMKIGVSLKYLQGITAAYTKNTNLNYTIADSENILVRHSDLDYGGARNFPDRKLKNLIHGTGLSAGIGFTYVYLADPSSCNGEDAANAGGEFETDYSYKIGVSFIDFGKINFNRYSSSYYLLADSAVYSVAGQPGSSSNTGWNGLADLFNQNDSLKHVTANDFNMALPAAISVQADWHVNNHFYVNTTIIKGMGHGNHAGIVRPDLYSITPRYESSWFEASLPVSLLYYQRWQPRIGFAFRVGYFFFGADAPCGLPEFGDFERGDLYAGIHLFPLERKHKSRYLQCPLIQIYPR